MSVAFYISAVVMLLIGVLNEVIGRKRHGSAIRQIDEVREGVQRRYQHETKEAEDAANEILQEHDPDAVIDHFQRTVDDLRAGREAADK